MGSAGSKGCSCRGGGGGSASASSTSGDVGRRGRSKGKNRVFRSSCLGAPSGSADPDFDHQVVDHRNKDYAFNFTNRNRREPESERDQVKRECYRKVKGEAASDDEMPMPCMSSNDIDIDVDGSRSGSSSGRATAAAHHSPSRCLSGFSFLPGNVSFRLRRANSLGSSRAYPVSPTSLAMLNPDHNPGTLEPPQNSSSAHTVNLHSPIIFNDADRDRDIDRDSDRDRNRRVGVGNREPVERNARFSRNLSVGRLRDRVLRRASLSDFTFCPLPQDIQLTNQTHAFEGDRDTRQSATSPSTTSTTASANAPSTISHNSVFNIQDHEVETSRSREARYHDLLEHRSNFLERRRRIRSQVRALQRLGGRFENFSGHERSCILSGQHRTGRCTCVNNRDSNSNDDASARASISRIVMLAEALFEVLDEIHQQSVVLSSRPSASSIGSVPAPNEVVESLPVKVYNKSHKLQNDEASQVYVVHCKSLADLMDDLLCGFTSLILCNI
ncbi:hypothetical protein REPUB_Repub03eG0248300 [Reevesia pubescens]